nr:hypothetical protein [Tanacetum cinerariifolium]
MFIQGGEAPNGWPFGLGSMNSRLSVRERVEVAADTREPRTFHGPSSSFSSFSSSNLDTESTVSFFQDNSVSLGRLIGIRPQDNGRLYFPRPAYIPTPRSRHSEALPDADQGVCVPNLMSIFIKISRSKSHSRH